MSKIIVNKFGGGILKKEYLPHILKRLKEQFNNKYLPVAVVSAMPGVTDELLLFMKDYKNNNSTDLIDNFIEKIKDKHNQIVDELLPKNTYNTDAKNEIAEFLKNLAKILATKKYDNELEDNIVSYGERLSAVILSYVFKSITNNIYLYLAEEIPIITDNNFKNANIKYKISAKNLAQKIKSKRGIIIISGFTGKTESGQITTLGRGGTDTTACFVGSAIKAEKVILWKDVGGVLSADPKIIKEAKTIKAINYFEAEEAGKIIHDKAIQYIKNKKTKLEIASITDPKKKTEIGKIKNKKGAKIIGIKRDLFLMTVTDENLQLNEMLFFVSSIFKKYKSEIILISNAKYSVQIVTDNKNGHLENVVKEIKEKVKNVQVVESYMIFAIGKFLAKDINDFNDLLTKQNAKLLISAFYYENCYRMEAIIKTSDINRVVKAVYKKFIR